MKEDIGKLQLAAEHWIPEEMLRWAFDSFGPEVAISSAFGAEGMVVIDLASRVRRDFSVFTLDTEFLFPETYNLMDQIEERYGIKIEKVYSLLSPEEQARVRGASLWTRSPDECCNLRKIEWDTNFGLVKINPIVDWSSHDVWQYIREHNVPYNPLHDRNYPSIGCTHCTRAIRPGEDARAGRWSGFAKTECGLHTIAPLPAEPADA